MTRKAAGLLERVLRQRGVYKPFVSKDGERLVVESYPLTAYITDGGCDAEMGPAQNVKVVDCSLARIGQDSTLTTFRVFVGQDVLQMVADYLVGFHGPAYVRAVEQDGHSVAREMRARELSIAAGKVA